VTPIAELRVRLLGGLAVEGLPVLSLGSRKARAVLRRLAVAAGGYVPADELVRVAWPEGAPARANDQLAVLVSRLRAVVGATRLERHPAGYALRADWLDTVALREHVRLGELALGADDATTALEEGRAAVALLRGPVLPEDESEPVLEERTAMELLAQRARLLAAEAALRTGSPWEAHELATRSREQDPYDEQALRLQLRALAATSRPALALTAYLEAAALLREELGTEPESATQHLYLDLLRQQPPERTPDRVARKELPGRQEQLAQLEARWRAAQTGEPSLVVVEGPPGIGKSALVDAFVEHAGAGVVLRAVPDVTGAELPLQPVLDALRQCLAQRDADAFLGPDRDLLAPLLGLAPTPTSTASAFAAVTTGPGRTMLLAALDALLDRLAADAPTLLLLDDAHLADETTAQLLHRAVRGGTSRRLLVVVAVRPDAGPHWHGTHVELAGLDREAVAAVVGEDRAADLHARSGGHPLFLAELVRHQGGEPPASVLAAVAARCAGTDDVAETLRAAAVLGSPEDVELLAAVLGGSAREVVSVLERAARQGLLVEDTRGFVFAHDLFREAFAAGVGPTRAAALHRDAAHLLDARRATDPRRVAHHAELGEEPLLAAQALTTAAELASQRYEHTEALNLLDRAIAAEDSVARRLSRARMLLLLGRHEEADADAEEALARGAGAAGLEVAALAAYFRRDLQKALELADEGARTATEPDLVAGCWCLAGRALLTMGRLDEALARLGEAADLATGSMRAVAAVWRANVLALRTGGPEAYRLASSPTAASARRDPAVEPHRALALGRSLTTLDRPYDALRAFEHLAEVVEEQQLSRWAGRADNFRSWVLRNLGAEEEADAASEAAWDAVGPLADLAHAEAHSHAALDLADAALRARRLDDAAAWLDRTSTAPTTPQVMAWRIDLRQRLLRGRLALAAGERDRALELAQHVRVEARRLGVPRYTCQADLLSARCALQAGDPLDLDAVDRAARALGEAAPLESWWLLAELAGDAAEARFRALAQERVAALAAGAGPYAVGLRAAAHRVLEP
jgi:DNA-binding SARP family transcriptional activator